MTNGAAFSFGPYCLIPKERVLTRNGEPLVLPPKTFEILVVLVENHGELVEKQELLARVWPDSFVEESNIQVHISSLRKFVDDGETSYIQTVPKAGYRFVGKVKIEPISNTFVDKGTAEVSKPNLEDDLVRTLRFPPGFLDRPVGSFLLFVIVAGIGFLLVSWYNLPERPLPFQSISVSKVTNSGNDALGAISPDGDNLAFQRVENGRASLWVKNLTSGAEKQLTSPSDNNFDSLSFSPSGNSVYFTQTDTLDPSKKTTLFELQLLNGDPIALSNNVDSRVTFSPDGKRIAFIRANRATGEWDLIVADSKGGDERIAASSVPSALMRWPAWSPVSNKIAIFKMNPDADQDGNRYSIIEVDADSGKMVQIGQDRWQTFGNIVWVQNGTGLAFTANKRGGTPWQIWYIDLSTKVARQVTNDTSDYSDLSIDGSSTIMTAVKKDFGSSIWVSDSSGTHDSLSQVTNGASTEEGNKGISFTPDGRLLYTGTTDGNWDIWVMERNGTQRMRLTSNSFLDMDPVAIADGSGVVYTSQTAGGTTHLWKMDPDGGNKTQLTNSLFESYPALSGDRKWLLYVGGENVKETKLWKIPLRGGQPIVLSELPVRSKLAISPEGSFVAFLGYENSEPKALKVIIMRIADGEVFKTLEPPVGMIPNTDIKWSADGKAITYKRKVGPVSNLWNLPIDGSPPREVTRFENELIYNFDWSKNGMLALTRGGATTDIVSIRPVP